MKKILSLILGIIFLVSIVNSATIVSPLAVEIASKAGKILPDNILYGPIDIFPKFVYGKALGLINKKQQIQFLTKVSEERLSEELIMVENNDLNSAGLAHDQFIKREKELKESVESIPQTDNIQESQYKHLLVLELVRQKVPEQAYPGIDNAIENSRKHLPIDISGTTILETKYGKEIPNKKLNDEELVAVLKAVPVIAALN